MPVFGVFGCELITLGVWWSVLSGSVAAVALFGARRGLQ